VRLGLAADHHAVVCLTDFTDRPLLDGILEGFAIARTERPGVRLLLVGSGPEEGAARWQAEELRLDDSVVFMGPSPEKWSLLSVCDGLVDAGSWPAWSRSSLEAMAAGLPVVRHVPETDGETPAPDAISGPPLQFARRFLALVRDPGVRAQLVRLSAERIGPHDVAVVAERWAQMYAS
jgi:glycosyltransferase involved in cell wall biosynthesis